MTPNVHLQKPSTSDRGWDIPLNANADLLDGLTALGSLAVSTTESPSTSLCVRVAAGTYSRSDRSPGTYGGIPSVTLLPNGMTFLWLSDSGTLVSGTSFPTSPHVRLAQVVTGPTSVLQVIDQRVQCATQGTGLGCVLKSGDTITGSLSVVTPASLTPVLNVDATGRAIGFFGGLPATQAPSQVQLTDQTTGIVGTIVSNVGASFSQSALNNNFATVTAQLNLLLAALKRHGLMSP